MKLVKIGRVGSMMKEVCVNDNGDLNEVLVAAGLQKNLDEDAWRNHSIISNIDFICNGDTIILEKRKAPVISQHHKDIMDEIANIFDLFCPEGLDEYYDSYSNLIYDEFYNDLKANMEKLIRVVKSQ